jgi:hypothetical protein
MHLLVTIITFMVFFIEAMLHYNIGINRGKTLTNFCLQMPALRDMIKIIVILAFFSAINGIIVNYVTRKETKIKNIGH